MTKKVIVEKALQNGARNFEELCHITGLDSGYLNQCINRRAINNLPMYKYKHREDFGTYRSSTTEKCIKMWQDYKKTYGVYPSKSWVAEQLSVTKERVRQILQPIIKYDPSFVTVTHSSGKVHVTEHIAKEIEWLKTNGG